MFDTSKMQLKSIGWMRI